MRLARDLRRLAADEGLTPAQAGVLNALVRRGPLRAGDLAAAEGLHPTMASRVLRDLEGDGLIERAPDGRDGRGRVVSATAAGRRRSAQLRARRDATLRERLAAVPPAELEALLVALPALEQLAGLA